MSGAMAAKRFPAVHLATTMAASSEITPAATSRYRFAAESMSIFLIGTYFASPLFEFHRFDLQVSSLQQDIGIVAHFANAGESFRRNLPRRDQNFLDVLLAAHSPQ